MPRHNDVVLPDMHLLIAWSFADEAARLAQVVNPGDTFKLAYQASPEPSFWMLVGLAPAIWVQVPVVQEGGVGFFRGVGGIINQRISLVQLPLFDKGSGERGAGIAVFQDGAANADCANLLAFGSPAPGVTATYGNHAGWVEIYASGDGAISAIHSTTDFISFAVVNTQVEMSASQPILVPGGGFDIANAANLILRSPNNGRWKLSVDDAGVLSVAPA